MSITSFVSMTVLVTFCRAFAQYPDVTIRQIQEVPVDSLRLMDTLQCTQSIRWTLQTSQYYGDTVVVTGVCVIPARVMGYTVAGFNLLLADTASPAEWGGVFVRPNISIDDSSSAIQWGILNVQPGDIIRFVGYVEEFPQYSCASSTQIVPLLNVPLEITGTAPVPPHALVRISDFSSGMYPDGQIRFSTGERYEGMRVLIGNAVIVSRNATTYAFAMMDSLDNVMDTFSARVSIHAPPYPFGARIDSLRGFVQAVGGSQRGYEIGIVDSRDVVLTDVKEAELAATASSYNLGQNYPNPFNPVTTISFSLPARSFVSLRVYDLLGREVSNLLSEELPAGEHSFRWDAVHDAGGVYFYRLQAGSFSQTKKLVVLR